MQLLVGGWDARCRKGVLMRRYPILLVPLVLVLVASCSSDSSDTTTTIAPTVEVTGQSNCFVESEGTWSGPSLDESGIPGSSQRDYVLSCIDISSDPRVEGDWTPIVNCDFTVNGDETVGECWGTSTGTNDGGTWEGTFTGTTRWTTTSPAHMHVIEQTATGTGDYEGLTYVSTIEGTDFPWTVTGEIGPIE